MSPRSCARGRGIESARVGGVQATGGWRLAMRIPDDQYSGLAVYRVTFDGRCWNARKTISNEEGTPLRRQSAGCVKLREQLRPIQRLLDSV